VPSSSLVRLADMNNSPLLLTTDIDFQIWGIRMTTLGMSRDFALPVAGGHYPGNLGAERSFFLDDAACLDYLSCASAPRDRCAHGADADAPTDQGPEPTTRRDTPTGRAELARKPFSTGTLLTLASRSSADLMPTSG
jgi:hypothetical protein